MDIQEYQSREEFFRASLECIIDTISSSAQPTIGLSGGSTPGPIYAALARTSQATSARYLIVDERYVPKDDPASNTAMIEQALITPTGAQFFSFDTSLPIEQSVATYADLVAPLLPMDLCILGMGTDGHTASLFPGDPALDDQELLTAHTKTSTHEVTDRLTLTFPAIMSSKKLLLLLRGEDKKVVFDSLSSPETTVASHPAKKLLEHPQLLVHYLSV